MSVKHFISPLAVAAASLLLAASCQKTPADPAPYGRIAFSPEGEEYTKAMLDNSELHTDGNKIKVYDYLTGFEGVINGTTLTSTSDPYKYIDDVVEYNGATSSTIWGYTTADALYPWTASGTHKFYGWLIKDNTVSPAFDSPATFADATQVLTYPEQAFTASSPQFDFIYSDIVSRDASVAANRATVDLKFKHLFTAIAFRFINESDNDITLDGFEVQIPNKGSMTLDYSGTAVAKTFTRATTGTYFYSGTSLNHLLGKKTSSTPGGRFDPISGATDGTPSYRFLWPALWGEIAPTTEYTGDKSYPNSKREYAATDSLMVIDYIDHNSIPVTSRVKFPGEDLNAGSKYIFTLKFVNKQIVLSTTELPWDYDEASIAYEEGAVVATPLVIDPTTCALDETKHTATVTSGKTIEGSFKILTPIGGTLTVAASGDIGYFDVAPIVTSVDPDRNGGIIHLAVTPKTSIVRNHDCKLKLKFYVTAHGQEIDANTIINPSDYSFVMLK